MNDILYPFFGMLLLTLLVWIHMYHKRLIYIIKHRIDPQSLTTPEKGDAVLPDRVSYPAQNLRNLFELPVIFYAMCLYIYVTGTSDRLYLYAAYAFLMFRVVHSVIHCTVNIVTMRFAVYCLSALALWFMVVRGTVNLILA